VIFQFEAQLGNASVVVWGLLITIVVFAFFVLGDGTVGFLFIACQFIVQLFSFCVFGGPLIIGG